MTTADLRPHQIFCLEQGNSRLYGELIQWIAERNRCWLRPIALCCLSEDIASKGSTSASNHPGVSAQANAVGASLENASFERKATLKAALYDLYDLRQAADLICPDSVLRIALDTEVLPILTQLHSPKSELAPSPNAHQLRQFIQQLWHANPEAFRR